LSYLFKKKERPPEKNQMRPEKIWSKLVESPLTNEQLVRYIKSLKGDMHPFLRYAHKQSANDTNSRFVIQAANQIINNDVRDYGQSLIVREGCSKVFPPYEFERCVVLKYNKQFGYDLPAPDGRRFLM
jgi:hypothetical protein